MATTSAQVRDVMRRTVRALTPAILAHVKFKAHDERVDFRTHALQNPKAAFRVFSIRDSGAVVGPVVSNTAREWIETVFEVVVAYPRDHSYGPQLAMDLDDVIESDLRQIEHSIGTNGYQQLELSTGGDAQSITGSTTREQALAVVFGVLTLNVGFWREMP